VEDKENLDSVEFHPVVMIGVACEFEEVFFPWIESSCDALNINIEKETDYVETFLKIQRIANTKFEYVFISGVECLYMSDKVCFVGIGVQEFPESSSIKRLKIDLYEDFEKMNLVSSDMGGLELINFWADLLIIEKGDENVK